MGSSAALLSLLVIVVLIIIIACILYCFWPMCKGQYEAKNATPLPPEEAQQIINSIQGEWDVTFKPMRCGSTFSERIAVTGSTMANMFPREGGSYRTVLIRPARTQDGALILDNYGSKVLVYTPELGVMETQMLWYRCRWKKAELSQSAAQSQVQVTAPLIKGSMAEEIQRLHQLKEQGVLTEEEFSIAKYKLLNPGEPLGAPSVPYGQPIVAPSAPYELPPPYPGNVEEDAVKVN